MIDEATAQLVVEVYVRDLERSLGFYQALGFTLVRHGGDFAVLRWDDRLLFLEQRADLVGQAGRERANVRVMVPDVDVLWLRSQALGCEVSAPVGDRYYGLRDFTVRDPDGFGLRFASPLK